MPRPMASGRSPFEVSSAIAVVMVRVKPSILPPTIKMAPTSAAARPKPASRAVTRLKRASQIRVAMRAQRADIHGRQLVAIFRPQVLDGLPGQRGDDRRDQHGLRDDHGLRREQQAESAERARARQQQIDRQADDDRRQAHQGVDKDDGDLAAGKAGEREQGADRHADQRGEQHRAEADDQRQPTIATAPGRR